MKRFLLLAAFTAALPVIALACGDSSSGGGTPDSGAPTATATDTTPTSTVTTPDAAPPKRTGCLDRPTNPQRPDKLPCELIPPGVTL